MDFDPNPTKSNVNYNGNPLKTIENLIFSDFWKYFFENVWKKNSTIKKNFFSTKFFLRHTSCLKSSKMHFYGNPTTDFVTRLPYIALGNLPKIRKIPMLWDILQWVLSYIDFLHPTDTNTLELVINNFIQNVFV